MSEPSAHRARPVCACCESAPADVILRVEFADTVDLSPWCMDCAAPVVECEYGAVVDTLALTD